MKIPLILAFVLTLATGQAFAADAPAPEMQKAYFAGGCFWCMQYAFDRVPGVTKTVVGYTGGKVVSPDYDEVSEGTTGHAESIEVQFDPQKISYPQLLEVFWKNIDPTTVNREFADRGTQYRTAIFYVNDEQKKQAEVSKAALQKTGKYDKPIVTEITAASPFYSAEAYHQEYYKTNPGHFQSYEAGSGRAGYIKKMWGDDSTTPSASPAATAAAKVEPSPTPMKTTETRPTKEELQKRLTPIQYRVTCEEGTEPAFHNAYWDNHAPGIYVDVISGKPLFSSTDKFESGTGWPSFTKPLDKNNVVEKTDTAYGMERTEVRAKDSDAHLGHVFPDGPAATGGMRFCMNSASLRFVPVDKLKEEGYGEYLPLFEKDGKTTAQK